MFSQLFYALCLSPLAIRAAYVATFNVENTGIDGTFKVWDGGLEVSLDISQINETFLPDESLNCTTGYKVHLHSMWGHGNNVDKIGETDCGAAYTGYHFDPWAACGTKSDNVLCETSQNSGCIDSSSYSCNFESDVYSCEVGDWSGKYGNIYLGAGDTYNGEMSSFFELNDYDLTGMSVVFHCADTGERAFCAPFVDDSVDSVADVKMDSMYTEIVANFGSYGEMTMSPDGLFLTDIDLQPLSLTCTSGNVLEFAIFNDWNNDSFSSSTSDCENLVGLQWDPTHQCTTLWSDSVNCYEKVSEELYTCNDTSSACDNTKRYDCAPGALSALFGSVPLSADADINNQTALLPDFETVVGKSIAFYCEDSWAVELCAVITGVTEAPTGSPTEQPTSSEPTKSPIITTLFWSTFPPNHTFSPTPVSVAPTKSPSMEPTPAPSYAPTLKLPGGSAFSVIICTSWSGLTEDVVNKSPEVFETAVLDALGYEETDVDVIAQDIEDDDNGVYMCLQIVTYDGQIYNSVDGLTASAEFEDSLESGVQNAYAGASIVTYNQESSGILDEDDIYESNEKSFVELFGTWYLLIGMLLIFVGSVWLIFLRAPVEIVFSAVPLREKSIDDVGSGNVELAKSDLR